MIALAHAVGKPELEQLAKAAHEAWWTEKYARGVRTWPNENGEEQMLHWDDLSEDVREFDRIVVWAILNQISVETGVKVHAYPR